MALHMLYLSWIMRGDPSLSREADCAAAAAAPAAASSLFAVHVRSAGCCPECLSSWDEGDKLGEGLKGTSGRC
jgi:hypothetical protein